MGKKSHKRSWLGAALALTLILQPTASYAAVPAEVYSLYGKNYADTYPDGVLDTISKYEKATRYPTMYNYLNEATYDTTTLDKRIEEFTARLKQLEESLMNGYDKPLSDIYSLEDEYSTVKRQLEEAKKTKKNTKAAESTEKPKDVPTKQEYVEALKKKVAYDQKYSLGDLEITYPINGDGSLSKASTGHTDFSKTSNSTVTAIFNGTVIKVDKDYIVVQHPGNIFTYYGGLKSSMVKEDEVVYQGEGLGIIKDNLVLKMKLNNEFVDVSKLFKEE